MSDDQIRLLLLAFALPAAIGLAAGGAIRLLAAEGWNRAALVAAPLALGVAYLAAHQFITGWPKWPPNDSESRLFLLGAGVAVLLAAAGASGRPGVAWSALALAAIATPIAILWPALSRALSSSASLTRDDAIWAGGAALGCLLIAAPVARTERDGYARAAAVILAGLCLAAGASLAAAHSMKLAQFAWALSAAVAGLGLLVPRQGAVTGGRLGPCGFGLPAALLAAILLIGGRYGDLPPVAAGLLAIAAPASFLGGLVPKVPQPWRIWARVIVAALVAGAAVITTVVMTEGGDPMY